MSRRYDSKTTMFSPDGRLQQVEYAREAISHATIALGILGKDGIMLAAGKNFTSKLLEQTASPEKIYQISDNVVCSVAGMTADANTLITWMRSVAQKYLFTYGEEIPVEQLVLRVCDLKQGYTQFGGLRPFGVSFIFAGWDDHLGYQLYHTDPSGNYGSWKVSCIGSNHASAQSILKQDYKDDITLQDASALAMKVLSKTMDTTSLTNEKLEIATIQLVNGKPKYTLYKPDAIDALLKENNVNAPTEEDAH